MPFVENPPTIYGPEISLQAQSIGRGAVEFIKKASRLGVPSDDVSVALDVYEEQGSHAAAVYLGIGSELDEHVRKISAFGSWDELIYSLDNHGYVPTIQPEFGLSERFVRRELHKRGYPVHPAMNKVYIEVDDEEHYQLDRVARSVAQDLGLSQESFDEWLTPEFYVDEPGAVWVSKRALRAFIAWDAVGFLDSIEEFDLADKLREANLELEERPRRRRRRGHRTN